MRPTRSRARRSSKRPRSAWRRSSVDLRLLGAEPSDAERAAIDTVVGSAGADDGRVSRADRTQRHLLLPALRAAQRPALLAPQGARRPQAAAPWPAAARG